MDGLSEQLQQLFQALHPNASGIDAQTLGDAGWLFERYHHDPEILQAALSAVLCKTAKDQTKFANLFVQYLQTPLKQLKFDLQPTPQSVQLPLSDESTLAGHGLDMQQWFDADRSSMLALIDPWLSLQARRFSNKHRRRAVAGKLSLRQTLRHPKNRAGFIQKLVYAKPDKTPQQWLFLLDVSQSMEGYSVAFLRFVHALAQRWPNLDCICFDRQLHWLEDTLSIEDPNAAYRALSRLAGYWGGGTQIASSLQMLIAQRIRGCRIVIYSDCNDADSAERLDDALRQLSQHNTSIDWFNPKPIQALKPSHLDALSHHCTLHNEIHSLESLSRAMMSLPLRH